MTSTVTSPVRFLSVPDLMSRWSASRSSVYRAVSEMAREGYLSRLFVGTDQRIALGSIERYETCHAQDPSDFTLGKSTVGASVTSEAGSTISIEPFTDGDTRSAQVVSIRSQPKPNTVASRETLLTTFREAARAPRGRKRHRTLLSTSATARRTASTGPTTKPHT